MEDIYETPTQLGHRIGGAARGERRSRRARRRDRHAPAVAAGDERPARGLHLRRRSVERAAGRQRRPAAHDRRRAGIESCVLARWRADRVQRAVRGEHRRVRGARAGGRAGAAHLAPRRRPRAGVHGRRQERAVHVGSRGLHDPVHAALHRSRGRRGRGGAADSQRGARDLLAGRPAHRLQPARPGVPAVEALPRRPHVAHLAVRDTQSRRRARPAAARPRERRGSDVGGRHGVLPIRSERRVQPVQLRHEVEGDPAADQARRLSRPQRVGRRRADCLRAGGPAARARPRRRDDAGADDRRSRGPA